MPWTIYSYITKEVLKLLTISAAVLVVLISMAAAIKPLADGLLGPQTLLKFVLFTSPTMLQFALPFAGAFATTLLFSRLTADNEVLACSANGISYRSILLPILTLGVAMMLGLYYLSNYVVPTFNQEAASLLEKDIIRIMVSEIQKGQSVRTGNWVLYADKAEEWEPTQREIELVMQSGSSSPPHRVIRLQRVAISLLDNEGNLRREGTAQTATILLYKEGGATQISFFLYNVVYFDAQRNDLLHVQEWPVPAMKLPSPLRDKPQFLSRSRLLEISRDREQYDKVRDAKRQLARVLAGEELLDRAAQTLITGQGEGATAGPSTLTLLGPGDERYVIRAPKVTRTKRGVQLQSQNDRMVTVESFTGGTLAPRLKIVAPKAQLTSQVDAADPDAEPRLLIELNQAQVTDARVTGRSTEHRELALPRSRWINPIMPQIAGYSLDTLSQLAKTHYSGNTAVSEAAARLYEYVTRLDRDIISQLHLRTSAAVSCMLSLVLGAALSMMMRGRFPLVIYFWSFSLTLAVVIIAQGGQSMCVYEEYHPLWGVLLIWSGNLLLLGAIWFTYLRLSRN